MNKKYIAINTYLVLAVILFFVLLGIAGFCAAENEVGLCIGFSLFLAVPIIYFVLSPVCFTFSDDCVQIIYHFGRKEEIKWRDIKEITLKGRWLGGFTTYPRYVIDYRGKEKRSFRASGDVPKTRKTKVLIEKYYKKKIARRTWG